MKVKDWNTLFEKRYIQKDYIPVTMWFGKEVAYSDMFHYRVVDKNTIIEFHFNKSDETLKRFNIVNLDRDMSSVINNSNFEIFKVNPELGSLYCDRLQWEYGENLIVGGFISDDVKMTLERFNDSFKINFKYSGSNDLGEKYYKLSESLLVSISEIGKIQSVTMLNFNDFNEIY